MDHLKAFLGGIGVSFTPCVYPLIPVIVGYIGIKGATSRLRGFALSFTYVSGIAITYSLLGLIASLTGNIFGAFSSHPATNIIVGLVIIIFGLSMFDLFIIPLPSAARLPVPGDKNYLSALLLGLSSGLVISPCTAPALGAVLVYLATKRNILYGTTLLLAFAYGMGLVLILSGTFSSLLVRIPKPGRWMVYIKRIFSLMLVAIGIYFVVIGIRRI